MISTRRSFLAGTGGLIAAPAVIGRAAAQGQTLRVSATPAIIRPMFEALVTAFTEAHLEIRIDLEVPPGEQEVMIQTVLRQAVTGDLPDVTFQGYNYLRILVDRDIAVPLDDLIAKDLEWGEATYSPSVAASSTVRGRVAGLGVGMSFPVFYYNLDLVRRVRPSGELPTSLGDILSLAADLDGIEPGVIGGFHRSHPWMFQAHIESRGGRLMSTDERSVAFAGAEGRETFKVLRRFGEAGQARADMTREQSRLALIGGTLGIFSDSSGVLARHEEQIGSLFDLGVGRFPITSGAGRIPAAGIASVLLTREPARQPAAWEFMKFVSGPAGQMIVAQNSAYVPANTAAAAEGSPLAAYFAERPRMQPALATTAIASAWYAFPSANALKIDDRITDAMQRVLTLREPPDSALATLTSEVEALL